MRIVHPVSVLILVNVHLVDVKDAAASLIFERLNANLERLSLCVGRRRHNLGKVLIAIVDLDITSDGFHCFVCSITHGRDRIKCKDGGEINRDGNVGLIKVERVSSVCVVDARAE